MLVTRISILCAFICCVVAGTSAQHMVWIAEHGKANIKSEAPLEIIQAETPALRGVIEPFHKSFAFTVRVNPFKGFNSDIQQTHFLENYLEHKKFPNATFTGKIIEDIPFDTPGLYQVRVKGNLDIHGIVKERIIRGTLTIGKGTLRVQTSFLVPVSDHGINIPKIVKQKISEQITVTIDIEFGEDYSYRL